MEVKKYALYLLLLIAAASCVPKKKIVYLQGTAGGNSAASFEPIIQPDDMLYINVTSQNEDAVQAFNVAIEKQMNSVASNRFSYLVDKDGNIDFPVLGVLKAGGLTRTEFVEMLKTRLKTYVSDPVVNLRFLNFKVTMLGEVASPGRINVDGDRLTLLDAIAQSGDLTLFGMRDNILIVRENNGEKTFNRVDITKADFVNSPFYYLKQNDVVYIEPRRAKVDSTAIGGNVTTILSIVSFLITTTLILTRL
ncbi:MAG: polysaccharide export protein [Flavobacterium sp.]|nr:MAG: polysaccharide export protein [Flavobacterium sp.]